MPRLPVQRAQPLRSGREVVSGIIRADELVNGGQLPLRSHQQGTGYQREPSPSRVTALARDIQAGRVDLVTMMLLNIRNFQASRMLRNSKGELVLDPRGATLWIVDGQTRFAALSRIVEADEPRWGQLLLPFSCVLGASEQEEMELFCMVCGRNRSVRTDIAERLLAAGGLNIDDTLATTRRSAEALTIVEALAQQEPWQGRVQFAGQPRGVATIRASAMTRSLQGIVDAPQIAPLSAEQRAAILRTYWQAVALVLPECFIDPGAYALQKATGAAIMHSLFLPALEVLRSQHASLLTPESWQGILELPLLSLEGPTASGQLARGGDFWKVGAEGAAGAFSGDSGRRALTGRLASLLPAVSVS